MFWMTRRSLVKCLDQARIVAAIESAERATSGEIRVSVAPFFWGRVDRVAWKAFHRLGMDQAAERNGILIFLVPSRRRFMVLGDEGIHAKVGQDFWSDVAACLQASFRRGAFTEGLENGISLIGERLADHFPHAGEADRNELPDHVDFGG
ncbi:TPM domain-containing protein [Holophaga foetida]|uniref:TPM domain-containing protein n=1 Tax=Holophaga foetida TaxID=35839 RepID=UPI0002471C93|nr:TPM domain-containing protein [Holophaga foetida]